MTKRASICDLIEEPEHLLIKVLIEEKFLEEKAVTFEEPYTRGNERSRR